MLQEEMTHGSQRMRADRGRDTAGVVAAPPVIYGVALIVALSMHAASSIHITSSPGRVLRLVGVGVIALGLLLSGAVMREFARAGTAVSPYHETTHFVSTGPYRYTRNPDYIGQTLMYAGIALATNSWWPLLLLPPALLTIHYGVVRREERYLEAKFGQNYRDYTSRVSRWL
jgi:protein-S-isoprenylcysteine O-methyltransferase Ste14